MHVTAIIAAGGRGERVGGATPKQLLSVGGRQVLERSVTAFLTHPSIDDLVVALPADLVEHPPAYLQAAAKPIRIVPGGPRRRDSVASAFRAVPERCDIVVVHDAARPFVSADLISRTIGVAAESGAALAALPASDTVKQASGLLVRATLDRSSIFLAQTPQAFRRAILEAALKSDGEATDEAALVERAGHPVRIVAGEASNIKITTSEDLALADALARQRPGAEPSGCGPEAPAAVAVRAGIGYDLHRMAGSGPLLLGGVSIPFAQGLEGHSDADAVCHAVTDAMLGAAAAGDLGGLFPDSDPRWKGASSIALLERAAEAVRDGGLEPANVDVVVIAERPRISPYVEAMRAKLAAALGVPIARVSIKGKTNEGVGELGRGEAIAVHAIALLRPRGA